MATVPTPSVTPQPNLERSEALGVAKQYLGPSVLGVVPFRNRDSDRQFLVVLVADPEYAGSSLARHNNFVRVLEGGHGVYVLHDKVLSAGDQFSAKEPPWARLVVTDANALDGSVPFGIVDVDADGNMEVFAAARGGGSGVYSVSVTLYDSTSRTLYSGSGAAGYSSPELGDVTMTQNLDQKRGVGSWILARLEEFNLFDAGSPFDVAVRDWERRNGRGFVRGKLDLQRVKGELASAASIVCTVDDVEITWRSLFKGPVLGYDRKAQESFVLFHPDSQYDWVRGMVAGSRYLWLGTVATNGLIAFEKNTSTLDVVPVPEAATFRSRTFCTSDYCSASLRATARGLEAEDSSRGIRIPLTLPSTIDVAREFSGAVGCR